MSKYTMRPLKTTDIFKASKILKELEIKVEVEEGETAEQVGVKIVQTALENLHKAENSVNDFVGGLVGLSGKEFGELPLDESFEILTQFKNQKGIGNFLGLVIK